MRGHEFWSSAILLCFLLQISERATRSCSSKHENVSLIVGCRFMGENHKYDREMREIVELAWVRRTKSGADCEKCCTVNDDNFRRFGGVQCGRIVWQSTSDYGEGDRYVSRIDTIYKLFVNVSAVVGYFGNYWTGRLDDFQALSFRASCWDPVIATSGILGYYLYESDSPWSFGFGFVQFRIDNFGEIWNFEVADYCWPSSAFRQICITNLPNDDDVIPRDWPCIMGEVNKNNGSFYIKHQRISEFAIKRKWFKCRISYYCNSNASFNFSALSIKVSGDVHPMPGPVFGVKSTISVRITNRRCHKPAFRCRDASNYAKMAKVNSRIENSMAQPISVLTTNRTNNTLCKNVRSAEYRHLVTIQRSNILRTKITGVRFSLLNVRSVRNKALIVKDYVVDNDIDVLALTETWLRPGNHDALEIGTLCPTGYRFMHVPRPSQKRGGGVGLLFKNSLEMNGSLCDTFQSFEIMNVRLKNVECVRILMIYRPPDSPNVFYEEFSRLLEQISAEHSGHLLIIGDLNFHLDNPNDSNAKKCLDILEAFDLKQHVRSKTHRNGHTLDVVITRSNDSLIREVRVRDPVISDHYAVHCDLLLKKKHNLRRKLLASENCAL